MNEFQIMTNRQLADLLDDEESCAAGITAIALTSQHGTALLLNAMAADREESVLLCLHEALDTELASHPRAFTEEMARSALAVLKNAELWSDKLVFACDEGRSRSVALAAAWLRICGLDDIEFWLNPQSYSPNVLIYARLLEAAGFEHTIERAVLRKMAKEAVLAGVIRGWSKQRK